MKPSIRSHRVPGAGHYEISSAPSLSLLGTLRFHRRNEYFYARSIARNGCSHPAERISRVPWPRVLVTASLARIFSLTWRGDFVSYWTFHSFSGQRGETSRCAAKFASKSADPTDRPGSSRAVVRPRPYIRRGTWGRRADTPVWDGGLTAPSRAASYHGPMPTLPTCPSRNKDGAGGFAESIRAELSSWGLRKAGGGGVWWYVRW